MPERRDEYAIEIEIESSFADDTGLFAGSENLGAIKGLNLSTVDYTEIEDDTYTLTSGKHETIEGLAHDKIAVGFSQNVEGLQTAVGDGDTAVSTAQVDLISLAMQSAPDLLKGGTVDTGSGTTTGATVADPTSLVIADTYGCVGVDVGGGSIEPRWFTRSGNDLTFLQAVSAAPADGATLYGSATMLHAHTWDTVRSAGIQFLGNDADQNRRILGAVLNASLAEMGSAAVPAWAYALKGAGFKDLGDISETRVAPPKQRGCVLGGGELLIGEYGSTAGIVLKGMPSFDLARAFTPTEDPNSSAATEAKGICGWDRAKSVPMMTVKLYHDADPPGSATDWRTVRRNGGGDFWLLLNIGQREAGRLCSIWMPRVRLANWLGDQEMGEQDAQTLTFVNREGQNPACGIAFL